MTTTTIPTLDNTADAIALMDQLAADHDWVSVFWDKGWGDASLDITIIVDGDGQDPKARITPAVYKQLRAAGAIAENSLQTFKARRCHDYKTPPAPEKTGPTSNDIAEQAIRAIIDAHPDLPIHAEFFRGLDPNSRLPRVMHEHVATPVCGHEWFVRLIPGHSDVAVSAAGQFLFGYTDIIGKAVVVRYPRSGDDVDLDALAGDEFKAHLLDVIRERLAAVEAERPVKV